MNANRRQFLTGAAWLGLAVAAGKAVGGVKIPEVPGTMFGYADADLAARIAKGQKLRVGVVGLGMRGRGAARRLPFIPGLEVTAICDIREEQTTVISKWYADNGYPVPQVFGHSEESYKALCESDKVDLVYICTPWAWHTKMACYAMEHGKHAATEVPSAMTVEECWQCVETAERTRRHCMQLENCCYGEAELATLNLVRQGFYGELKYGECGYIHDLRLNITTPESGGSYQGEWRMKWNMAHKGDMYATHGLVPQMQWMNINRTEDRMDYLVSMEGAPLGFADFIRRHYPADDPRQKLRFESGDMNYTLIKTLKGRTILVEHDVQTERGYSRINRLHGARGWSAGTHQIDSCCFEDESGKPIKLSLTDEKGRKVDGARAWNRQYAHPFWRDFGNLGKKVGGHGGMDFLMDLRLAYCLQNGLALDQDVYDLASSCCIAELSERSVRNRSASQDIPDFTRGAWKTAKPLGIINLDKSKLPGLSEDSIKSDKDALEVS